MQKTILSVDIGGSKIHVGWLEGTKEEVKLIKENKYKWEDVKKLDIALKNFIEENNIEKIDIVSIGIAGPVEEEQKVINITNLGISINIDEIKNIFKCKNIFAMNDLVAHGYGIVAQKDQAMYDIINEGKEKRGNKALLAAGTGLGESILFYDGHTHIPFATEGGHSTFSPVNEIEIDLLKYARNKYNSHISVERLVSGSFGIPTIFEFLCEYYQYSSPVLNKIKTAKDAAPIIYEEAEHGDELCIKTIKLFLKLYAQEASNLALKAFAVGGIYIGGGIITKLQKYLNPQEFVNAFCDKGRFSNLLSQVPIKIIKDKNNALKGAAFGALLKIK